MYLHCKESNVYGKFEAFVFFHFPCTQTRFVGLIALMRLPDGQIQPLIPSDSLLKLSGQTLQLHSKVISR